MPSAGGTSTLRSTVQYLINKNYQKYKNTKRFPDLRPPIRYEVPQTSLFGTHHESKGVFPTVTSMFAKSVPPLSKQVCFPASVAFALQTRTARCHNEVTKALVLDAHTEKLAVLRRGSEGLVPRRPVASKARKCTRLQVLATTSEGQMCLETLESGRRAHKSVTLPCSEQRKQSLRPPPTLASACSPLGAA